jgi:hypothetical protein
MLGEKEKPKGRLVGIISFIETRGEEHAWTGNKDMISCMYSDRSVQAKIATKI